MFSIHLYFFIDLSPWSATSIVCTVRVLMFRMSAYCDWFR